MVLMLLSRLIRLYQTGATSWGEKLYLLLCMPNAPTISSGGFGQIWKAFQVLWPWVIISDFNCIQEDGECIGGQPRAQVAMTEFNYCINNYDLLELHLSGGRMSWFNGHDGLTRKLAKLDRALTNIQFLNKFLSTSLDYLERKTSNPKSLMLHILAKFNRYSPSPFKCQNLWSLHNEFFYFIKQMWLAPIHGFGLIKLAAR